RAIIATSNHQWATWSAPGRLPTQRRPTTARLSSPRRAVVCHTDSAGACSSGRRAPALVAGGREVPVLTRGPATKAPSDGTGGGFSLPRVASAETNAKYVRCSPDSLPVRPNFSAFLRHAIETGAA